MADYQASLGQFEDRNTQLVTFSSDSKEDAQALTNKLGLTFPVGYGIDAADFAAKTGAFYQENRGFIHATGFILRKDGTVLTAVYSSGPIGRITVPDALAVIDFYTNQAAKN